MKTVIKGPGEYRTRDGKKTTITGTFQGMDKLWWAGFQEGEKGMLWDPDTGRSYSYRDAKDIIGHWQEEIMQKKVDLTEFNKEIDSSTAICKQGKADVQKAVAKLVKAMGYEVENPQPEVKAGQVWVSNAGDPFLVLLDNIAMWLGKPPVISGQAAGGLSAGGKFLANSLDEYYAKKQRGEV